MLGTDRPTDRQTDRPTDIAAYRAAIAAKKEVIRIHAAYISDFEKTSCRSSKSYRFKILACTPSAQEMHKCKDSAAYLGRTSIVTA